MIHGPHFMQRRLNSPFFSLIFTEMTFVNGALERADAFRLRLSCHRWKEREFLFYLSIYLFIYSLCPRLNICIRQDSPVLKIIFYQQLHSTPLDVYTMCYVICTQSYIRFDACPAATSGWLLSGGCGKVCQMFLRFLFSPSRFDVLPPGRDGPHQS